MRIFSLALLLVSGSAWACPDLRGNYTCVIDGETEQITFQQEVVEGVTIYSANGTQIPADNVLYPLPDSAELKQSTFRAFCESDKVFTGQILGKYYNDNMFYGDVTLNLNYQILENGNLKHTVVGEIKNSGAQMPISSETICERVRQ